MINTRKDDIVKKKYWVLFDPVDVMESFSVHLFLAIVVGEDRVVGLTSHRC